MKTIVITSTNKGKTREIIHQLSLSQFNILTLNHFNYSDLPQVDESGSTFRENALLKARTYHEALQHAVIADDSGLVVPALKGEPGVYSARYAGLQSTDDENNHLLLERLKDLPEKEKYAFFQIVMVYKDSDFEKIFEGRCDGRIISKPKGAQGFGYDPIFYVPKLKKTMAELTLDEKTRISHRGKALSTLKMFLKKLDNNSHF